MSLTSSGSASETRSAIPVVSVREDAAAGSASVVREILSLDQVNVAFADVDAGRKRWERGLPAAEALTYGDTSRRLRNAFLQPPAVVALRSPTILA